MMPVINLSVRENEILLNNGVTVTFWFTRSGSDVIRTEVYQAYDGSVVAYHDCVNGEWQPLYMEKYFMEFNKGEDDFLEILQYVGVSDLSKIKTYNCGR